jgi:hypothetical protein
LRIVALIQEIDLVIKPNLFTVYEYYLFTSVPKDLMLSLSTHNYRLTNF